MSVRSCFRLFAAGLLLLGCTEAGDLAVSAPAPKAAAESGSARSKVMADIAMAEPIIVSGRYSAGQPRRGVVTAGDIDDALNLTAFRAYQAKSAKALDLPRSNVLTPVQLQLLTKEGAPAPGVSITLRKPGAAQPFYEGVSGVDGNVTVFPATLGAGRMGRVELRAFEEGAEILRREVQTGAERLRMTLPAKGAYRPEFLDLVFVFDTTGSMGDELAWLSREFAGIVRAAQRSAPGADLRYGLVAYRDQGDAYVVQNFGMTKSQSEMSRWLKGLDANGGGDYPEAADRALQAGADLPWRRGRGERLMFHIADAPPHKQAARAYLRAAAEAAGKGVQIYGLGASGVGKESEFLMRQAALVTGGRYMFLTDDSGVGNAHAEPTVACYRVTKLKALLINVLRSELTGLRKEASSGDVIRTVGNYSKGKCAQ